LRSHLGHDELPQHLDLLNLGESDLIAHLNRLKIANRGPVLHLEHLQSCLLTLKILGLRLRALKRAVQGVERGIDACLRALHARRIDYVVAGIELLELLRKPWKV
jgi:hypothetical protein